jgi:mono/diheme cytochrome c family protein
VALSLVAAFVAALGGTAGISTAQEDRGAYLVRIMDCGGCHTPGTMMGKPDMSRELGGGDVGFEVPGLGVFYPPNLTSHATGAGSWSEAEIIRAVTEGVRPDGRQLIPIMPYHSYSALTQEDAQALARYLQDTTPVENDTPDPIGPGQKSPMPYLTIEMPK